MPQSGTDRPIEKQIMSVEKLPKSNRKTIMPHCQNSSKVPIQKQITLQCRNSSNSNRKTNNVSIESPIEKQIMPHCRNNCKSSIEKQIMPHCRNISKFQ